MHTAKDADNSTRTSNCPISQKSSLDRKQEFEHVVSRGLPRFRRLALRWLRNVEDAEDVVQDALLSAFRHIAQFNGRAQMSTWLTAIVINAARMQLRRRARSKTFSFEEVSPSGEGTISQGIADSKPTQEKDLERRELCELVIKLTGRLPRSQRAALELRVWHNLSIQQVASVQKVAVGTIKARLSRGRAELKQRFLKAVRNERTSGRPGMRREISTTEPYERAMMPWARKYGDQRLLANEMLSG
jgi:RNA polymerase sigma-70 factor, ECF subfamily